MYGIESQSRRRAAIRSKTDTLVIDASSRGELRPPASHPRHHRFRPQRSATHDRPRPSHRLCSHRVGGRHHRSRGNSDSTRDRRHRSASLSAEASRKKHHKTCEDDLTDHGSHLKARPAEPFTNNPSPIPKMRPEQHWFQFNSLLGVGSLSGVRGSSFPIPYSLRLCYNRRAVERTTKWELTQVQAEPGEASSAAPLARSPSLAARIEDPSWYCPVCSQRLESWRCRLICSACGYYMSCADYY